MKNISIENELHQELKVLAASNNTTMHNVMKIALKQFIESVKIGAIETILAKK